jgi:glyoxylase-like metal-dependent hydrolase (beta-lactamase superfamily II)
MRRAIVLGVLIAIGSLSIAVTAYQPPPAGAQQQGGAGRGQKFAIEVEKLRDNLFVLRGGGGNTAVFVQTNGITVVDTKNPGWGQPILDKIKELSPKAVTTIINTHTHGDHVSGNVEFPTTVEVIVHENTAANMKKMAPVTGVAAPGAPVAPNIFEQNQWRGMPKRTFKDSFTFGSGADRIDLFYFGRGHTNGDTWILFPALRVVHAGDIFAWPNQIPILDANNGGSGLEMADTLMKAHDALIKSADQIITGHAAVVGFEDLRKWADFNRSFLNQMREAKKAGRTVEEVTKTWTPPAGFVAPAGETGVRRLQGNVQTVFNELK